MKKVLVILSRLDKTGMTTNTIDLCEGLSLEGNSVTLLLGKGSEVDTVRFISRLDAVNVYVKYFSNPLGIGKCLAVLQILWYVLMSRADIIHVESPYFSFIPWLLGKKFTSTFHVTDLVRCFYYKNATHLIAISKETKDFAKRVFGYKEEDITIVHHGVSTKFAEKMTTAELCAIKKYHNIPTDKIIMGLVGSIEKRKGHDILMKAFIMLPREIRDRCHIVFCGSDKNKDQHCKKWLLSEIEQCNLKEKITVIEYCDPMPVYKCFDLAVFPSRLEGFPLTSIEALMTGVCTLRSDVEGATEQIEDGKTGYIFRNEDVEQLSQQMIRVLKDDDLRKRLAKAGQEKAMREFSIAAMAKNTMKVYEKML